MKKLRPTEYLIAGALGLLALLLVFSAHGQALGCTMAPGVAGAFTLTCAPASSTPKPPDQPPPVEPPKPPGSVCAGVDPRLLALIDHRPQLDLNAIMFRWGRGTAPADRECMRERGVPGSELLPQPVPTGQPADPGVSSGFVLDTKHHPRRNYLQAGQTYAFTVPTSAGERVTLIILEVVGTPDSMSTRSSVLTADGRVLSGPTEFGRHGSHTVISPGGALNLHVTPAASGWLGVQRN